MSEDARLASVPFKYGKFSTVPNVTIQASKGHIKENFFEFRSERGDVFSVSPLTVVNMTSTAFFVQLCDYTSVLWPLGEMPIFERAMKPYKATNFSKPAWALMESCFVKVCNTPLPPRSAGETREEHENRAAQTLFEPYSAQLEHMEKPNMVCKREEGLVSSFKGALKFYCMLRISLIPDHLLAACAVLEWLVEPHKVCLEGVPRLREGSSENHGLCVLHRLSVVNKRNEELAATTLVGLALVNAKYSLYDNDECNRTLSEDGTKVVLTDKKCEATPPLTLIIVKQKTQLSSMPMPSAEIVASLWKRVSRAMVINHEGRDWRFCGPTLADHFSDEERLARTVGNTMVESFIRPSDAPTVTKNVLTTARIALGNNYGRDGPDPFASPDTTLLTESDVVKLCVLYMHGEDKDSSRVEWTRFTWPSLERATRRFVVNPSYKNAYRMRSGSSVSKWIEEKGVTMKLACKILKRWPRLITSRAFRRHKKQ